METSRKFKKGDSVVFYIESQVTDNMIRSSVAFGNKSRMRKGQGWRGQIERTGVVYTEYAPDSYTISETDAQGNKTGRMCRVDYRHIRSK